MSAAPRDAERVLAADLFREVGEWADATFPHSTDRSKLAHLRRELAELEVDPSSPSEMADCFMLLIHLARSHSVDPLRAIRDKLAVCKAREWGQPDADGVVEHVRRAARGGRDGGGES